MVPYLGDFAEDATVYIPFNTFDSNDPSASATITNLADADIKVHKDGSATQIVTDGATVAIDFDTITGNHLITIDTSAHADYSTGSDYLVRIEGTTVDAGTINAFVASFSIQNRYSAGALRPTTAGRTLDVTATGAAGIDWGNVENPTTAVDLSATDIQLCDTITTYTGNTVQTGDSFARIGANGAGLTGITGAQLAADQAVNATKLGGAAVTATTSVTIPAASTLATTTGAVGSVTGNVGGIAGTIQTLDALDTAQDTQHSTTQSAITGLNDLDAAGVATAVWNAATITYGGAGTYGQAVEDTLADTGELQTNQGNWLTATGFATPTNITAASGVTLAPTTGLGNQTANITGNLSGSVGSVTGAVGSVTGNVGGNVTGSVGSNLELGPTEVNAEVVDALNTDTYAEPAQGAPGATISLAQKIGYLYKAFRNRSTQTATTYSLYNDDATTVDHKATVSDDGTTADKGEVATGP